MNSMNVRSLGTKRVSSRECGVFVIRCDRSAASGYFVATDRHVDMTVHLCPRPVILSSPAVCAGICEYARASLRVNFSDV